MKPDFPAEESYYDMASRLAEHAPAQARLLRYLLLQDEMQEMEKITADLKLTESNFRILTNKLRDKGIEVVCVRTHAPDDASKDVRYLYGITPEQVEDWSGDRRKAVLTAWGRATRVFERHLLALDLPASEVYEILGVMKFVTKTLQDIDLGVSVRAEAIAAEKAAAAMAEATAKEEVAA